MAELTATVSAKERRTAAMQNRNRNREQRWKNERFSVPYRTDRPTISLSILWFVAVVLAIVLSQWAVAVVAAAVAGVAALQTGHAWAFHAPSDRRVAAGFAALTALSGLAGTFGLGLACVILSFAAFAYSLSGVDHHTPLTDNPATNSPETALPGARTVASQRLQTRPKSQQAALLDFTGILIRSSIPAGLAAGSLVALTGRGIGAAISLVVLVSAYEIGDYLVGTGSANAIEGPIAGIAVLAVAGAALAITQPSPFDGPRAVLFAILTAISCPLGQILGSAILPRGDSWAPGLRRLDSLLIAGPLWLLLL